jgi:hypothetical protein
VFAGGLSAAGSVQNLFDVLSHSINRVVGFTSHAADGDDGGVPANHTTLSTR